MRTSEKWCSRFAVELASAGVLREYNTDAIKTLGYIEKSI